MAEDGLSETEAPPRGANDRKPSPLTKREWVILVVWPWVLAVAAVLSCKGTPSDAGLALARFTGAAVVIMALLVATSISVDLGRLDRRARIRRAALLALGALGGALPALGGMALSTGDGLLMVISAAAYLAVCGCAFALLAAATGTAYPGIAAAWLGAPPFLYYMLMEMAGADAGAVLMLSPASGAVTASTAGSPSLWFMAAGLIPALGGAAAALLAREEGAAAPE